MIRFGLASSRVSTGREEISPGSPFSGELAAKRLELLRELVPRARDIAVLINSGWPTSARFKADVETAAPVIGLAVQFLDANNEREIESCFRKVGSNPRSRAFGRPRSILRQPAGPIGSARCQVRDSCGL